MTATTLRQMPPAVDLEFVAGNPFTVTVTCSGATISSPAVTMKTSGGDAYTTDPGVPSVSLATNVITSAWSATDSAALNTSSRAKSYRWSLQALVNGDGPYELLARTITVQPVGSAGSVSSTDLSLAVTVGATAVDLALTVGPGGTLGQIDGGSATSVYGGTTSIDGGSA